jgi:pyruvate dehydrogenase E2 component (dihydrolipoamide acetyltransferase)
MANDVRLPRLGQGMETGTVVKWLKAEGDRVEKGEPLFEVDTDKATQEVEAEHSGVLLRIDVHTGEVPVGQTVGVIGKEGEQIPAPGEAPSAPSAASQPERTLAAVPRLEPAVVEEPAVSDFQGIISDARARARVKASPLAKRIARERAVDLRAVRGSGPDGRILADDVERSLGEPTPVAVPAPTPAAAPLPVSSGETESIPLSSIRKTIARRLSAAWQLPVFQLTISIDMAQANALVARSRELNPETRVTVTDLLVKVCARALVIHPELNAQFTEEALLRYPSANVGIAVAAPQGLVVPVIASAERLSLVEIAERRSELVGRARESKLSQADLEGGTFTISNLGMFGVEQFTAILNPPQAAILAVGATVERPVVSDGKVVVAPIMSVTLTVDHRAVDGGPAAQFLQTVKTFLEAPALAL